MIRNNMVKSETRTRYTVTMDFYIYAEDDKGAVKEAFKRARKMDKAEDNQPLVLSVHRTPFASLFTERIYDHVGRQYAVDLDEIDKEIEEEE